LIPRDWTVKSIGDLASFSGGSQPSLEYFSSIKRKDYIRLIQIRDYKTEKYTVYIPKKLGRKFCDETDVMIGRYGPPIFQILTGLSGAYNVALIKATPKNIEKKYLYYILKQDKLFKYIELLSQRSSGQTGVDLKGLKEYNIPFPTDIKEQKAIATALSDMDDLILSLEKLISKKKMIKDGAMEELLTGEKRLVGFNDKWSEYIIDKIGKSYGGLTGKKKEHFSNGNAFYIPFMNVMSNPIIDVTYLESVAIKEGEIQNRVKKGDLLFNTSSETPEEVGMCSVLKRDLDNLYLNSFCFGFRLNNLREINPLFLSYLFRSKIGRTMMSSLAQGSTRYNLSKSNFNKLTIQLPKYNEQEAIADILSDMDNEIKKLEKKLDKYKNIKSGMMEELLTGKRRLV
jgi:type I restriction enzyme S subunit